MERTHPDNPARATRKAHLAMLYCATDNPAAALRELWAMLDEATLDGGNALQAVRKAATSPRARHFNRQQVLLIHRALGLP